jgi:hypothetical protein
MVGIGEDAPRFGQGDRVGPLLLEPDRLMFHAG